ncbi:hypothetical protein C8R28_101316 [Nitrosomonas ureae]|uniref:Uncharacterized protein n=1 Tax=Nitrosomonas ureae TaxID=44577 RepID=A0A2T5INY5_9PROT|nr:hypothetical protein C8R28_101316 [Nitrosomonas ureae]
MLSPGPRVKSEIKPIIVSSDHFLDMYDTAQTTISIVTIVAAVRMIPASLLKTLCYWIILLQYRFKETPNNHHFKHGE